ncbi:hypothetical protein ACP6EU_06040 [Acinetobacter baumannii]|uniref:hypothetical protein n=1 Tax=Acinetobacter baumannii TaxID=470 RepID=UPI003CEDD3E1
MDNYKIKVKDEAESKEAQELFVQLGFEKTGFSCDEFPCYLATWEGGFSDYVLDSLNISRERKELTLPQLRDLVVLKRNDKADGNYKHRDGSIYYITSDNEFYLFDGRAWLKSLIETSEHLIEIEKPQPQDPALISGAEALRALADGKEVEYNWLNQKSSKWMLISEELKQFNLYEILSGITEFGAIKFRLKPQTIKLELEIPAPFEPKVGDIYWFLSPFYSTGYDHCTFTNDSSDKLHVQYGAYRSEDDVKKAVEQLRKIRGTNS